MHVGLGVLYRYVCVGTLLNCTTTDPTSSHEGMMGGVYLE